MSKPDALKQERLLKAGAQEQHRRKEKKAIVVLWLAVVELLLGVVVLYLAYSITNTELKSDVDNLRGLVEIPSSATLQDYNELLQNGFEKLVEQYLAKISQLSSQLESQISQLSNELETQITQLNNKLAQISQASSQFFLNLSSIEESFREQVEQNNQSTVDTVTQLSQDLQACSISATFQQQEWLARSHHRALTSGSQTGINLAIMITILL